MLLLTALRPPNTSRIWPTLSPCTTSKWNIVLSKGVLGVSHLFSIKRTFKASMHIASSDNSESDSILHSTSTFLLIIPTRTWKDMSLDDKITEFERTKLAVWDYPVTDKWTRIWQHILENGAPMTFEEALEKVRSEEEKFVLMGEIIIFTPLAIKTVFTNSGRYGCSLPGPARLRPETGGRGHGPDALRPGSTAWQRYQTSPQ